MARDPDAIDRSETKMTSGNRDRTLVHRSTGRGSCRDAPTPHEQAVLHAEVTCLVNALTPFRVLRRDALARAAGATRWHEQTFDRAIEAAVQQGKINELPLRFYALPRTRSGEELRGEDPGRASDAAGDLGDRR